LVVTGTGTDVGKTVVTAAIAALAADRGERVTVVKPAQTGVAPGEESDADVVCRLSGVADVHELIRYDAALAPASAARLAGVAPMAVDELVRQIGALPPADLLIVEGAGGLLVHLDDRGGTIADVARQLDSTVLVVAAAGLGTLNATALTTEALERRGLRCAGVVVGAWPSEPDLAMQTNLVDFPGYARAPLLGVIPAGAGRCSRDEFRALAHASLAPGLGGRWSLDQSVSSH
jgi:dethiobiotin synthetase